MYSLYSKYILSHERLIAGYVCIKGQSIKHILNEDEVPADKVARKLGKYPLRFSFQQQVVMAGGIDTSIALNPGKPGWDHTETISK